jgi:hypothetical protein
MTTREPSPRPKKSLALSLATGALLVPLSAFGASSLLSASTEESPPAAVASTTTTVAELPTADLGVACGEEGMQLVAAESTASISDVQRAALDALRDICAAAGLPLPGPAVPQAATTTAPTVPASTVTTTHSDDDDHGRHGGDRDDDDRDSDDRDGDDGDRDDDRDDDD